MVLSILFHLQDNNNEIDSNTSNIINNSEYSNIDDTYSNNCKYILLIE